MSVTIPDVETHARDETGYPWYDRHAMFRGREIYQWCGYIGGCEWESNAHIRAHYAASRGSSGHTARFHPGFVGFVTTVEQGFASWEAAEAWLFGGDVVLEGAQEAQP